MPPPVEQLMSTAVAHHQAGRFPEAESLYRQVLASQPYHADAAHLLGVLCGQTGRLNEALEWLTRAIAVNPKNAIYHGNHGKFLVDAGRTQDALNAYRRALALNPNQAQTHNNLGTALQGAGRLDEAMDAYRAALALQPDYAEAHNNLGGALKDARRWQEARVPLLRALNLRPTYAEALANLGGVLKEQGELDQALALCQHAVRLKPELPIAHNNVGLVLSAQGRLEEAEAAFAQAIRLAPAFAEAYTNMGNVLKDMGRYEEAVKFQQKAIEIRPAYAEALDNMGVACKESGDYANARIWYGEALAIQPDYPEAHWNMALLSLLLGDFQRAWREFEWRWKCQHLLAARRDFLQPAWDGSPLNGRALLLYAEQGFGDTIQFVRFAAKVGGGRIILECQPELRRLLEGVAGVDQLVSRGETLPPFDVQSPLMSLPLALGTTLETIPAPGAYLWPEPFALAQWRARMAASGGGRAALNIGLVWAGNPGHRNDRHRSMPLKTLAPLSREGINFWSLQIGAGRAQAATAGFPIIDATAELRDFADTAALVASLDLVIAVDTAVCHLAGALGRPVWVMVPKAPDWRWLRDRPDCPWYPTMRLFRQDKMGEWGPVVERISAELARGEMSLGA